MNTRAVKTAHPTRSADLDQVPGPQSPALGTAGGAGAGIGVGRRVLGAVALAATVPYLTLKAAWLAGSGIGIPRGSVLRDPGLFFTVANSLTLAMDACLIALVLVLTRPWGMRVPAWLLVVPAFVATGLLTPILTGFPGQLLIRALGVEADTGAARAVREPFLDPWVFDVVYTGFTVQGLALAGLFVPYARQRWGHRWQGVPGPRLPSSTGVVAGAAAAAGLLVGAAYLYWGFGGTAGLTAGQRAERTADWTVVSVIHAACAGGAGAGAVLLARGWWPGRGSARGRARWPLALAWTGSAAALSWGAWLLIASLSGEFEGAQGTTGGMYLAYAGQMITGLLGVAVLARFLTARRTDR
ncbi:hypothetical protein ABZY31_14170 [Streptomyces sp. NPDC006529]|uniref:hypothetical protein n=1 Tax=Streptomyces sp. NPDC006529 TaxID=3157177 RepID=UPI0033B64CE0